MKRGGKSAGVRLSQDEWVSECDRIALLTHILHDMYAECSLDGAHTFDVGDLEKVGLGIMEGRL